ncbi:hypothetical protein GA0116948_105307 [Chitinophaga costaii]|uniref:Probable sensor domain-containing protein n=1 Tax=Chitinophaga costaii TaxID=1335309 RepID=A0A1C4DJA2_9BACT|nr:hypothetical protein [Chitinophaga costaii]PUZ24662.1 hypothetical protein DCM91_12295 [Chitinophaga costaii]SCC31449.1 hypothetical protein GA0116948_105307 [Chitinophaga costaii]
MELMHAPTYQAARQVAEQIEIHFIKHRRLAQDAKEDCVAPAPNAFVIEKIIDTAFWASLNREEGNDTRISLAFMLPSQTSNPLLFEEPLPFTSKVLTKLAPGVERSGIHVGVWYEDGELCIWGTTTSVPNLCFVVDVSEPGLLVIKHRRITGLGKFTNVAVLRGDQVKIIDEDSGMQPDTPAMLTALLGIDASPLWNNGVNVLIQMAVSMRAHRHGGTLLVVPNASDKWRESIIHPMQYPVAPAFGGIAELIRKDNTLVSELFWQNAIRREVENLSGLTAVDGATVINEDMELIAFGVKTSRAKNATIVEKVLMSEPVVGGHSVELHASAIGGTRHFSAAQFVHDQHDALALVASQDGYFTIFSWSPARQVVQAHRIDTLLL